ncbi:MAG: hypothetical protein ABI758_03540 [Candidatus Woesebacteria bacterium]
MKYKILFLIILVVAILTRFIKLGSFPSGLTWDEAAIGYNAYGLITNHRDEWLKRTPIVFQSFGDFKSPLLIYLTTIPVLIFGLTPFAVRIPIALAGTGLVITSFFLTREITKRKDVSLFVMFLIAVSPWAIHYSRMGFESMLATFLVSVGIFSWLKGRSKPVWMVVGDICFALSLYAYHSAKIVVPLAAIILCTLYYKDFFRHKKLLIIGTLLAIGILLPLGYASVFGKANSRALSTTIIGKPNMVSEFANHYLTHLSPSFLLYGGDITYRHSTRQVGVLYPVELILFVFGILAIVMQKEYRKFWWIPVLFFIGLIPPALGLDVPHSNRALLALPWVQITAGIGVFALANRLKVESWKVAVFVSLFAVISFVSYIQIYATVYSSETALKEMGYGYDEVMNYVRSHEGEVDRVYFTNVYGQAYIYILFAKKLTPVQYQNGGLANYTIANNPWKESQGKERVLVIGTADEIPDNANIVKEVKFPDGKIAFRIARR